MHDDIRIIAVRGIGEVEPGTDLATLILTALDQRGQTLESGDVVVVTQKIVSKAEGRIVDPQTIEPSEFARQIAAHMKKDPHQIEIVLRESARIVRMNANVLLTETRHGLICANSGVDESNVGGGHRLTLLPHDPDHSAAALRAALRERTGCELAVIITDTFGRAWREGQVNFAIGSSGLEVIANYVGVDDPYGYTMNASKIGVGDELAAAAELVMGKIDQVPVAIVRGYHYIPSERATARDLLRDPKYDLFR